MYLQLADNGNLSPATPNVNTMLEYMVQIPDEYGNMVWVREDQLDDLPDDVLYQILQQQPHLSGVRDWFQRMRARKQERKAGRQERRAARREGRRTFIGGLVDKVTGAITGPTPQERGAADFFPQVTGGAEIGVSKWWQNPMVIGGMVLALVAGTYILTRKK